MTHTSKGELSDLNLTSNQWHYVENASTSSLKLSLEETAENYRDFAEAIKRELGKRCAATELAGEA